MSDGDPHVHVEVNLHADAAVRDLMASTFGLAGDLPSRVTTGCGLRVPYAMTSPRPESVTCPACRRHAHRRHLRLADEAERIGRMPGMSAGDGAGAVGAARRHREIAERFLGAES
ncbi:hypothetical protein AB0L25_05325 [Spirillospora sp. NPDC052242]